MSDSKEEALEAKISKSSARLKAATGFYMTMVEPMAAFQRFKWENMMLRAELTALRDILLKDGRLDTTEYQKRTMDYIDQYTSIIERDIGIQVGPDGVVVDLTPRAERNKGLLKPS